jgi:hypothetical protein
MKNILISLFLLVTLSLSAQQSVVPASHYPLTNQVNSSDVFLIIVPGITNRTIASSNLFGALLAVSSYGGFNVTTNIGNQLVVTMTNGVATNLTVLGTFTSTNNTAAIQLATNGLVTSTITNGLATTNFVKSITNGLATTNFVNTITNGLATTNYVNTATNNFGRTVPVSMTNWANQFTGIYTFPSNAAPVVTGSNVVFWNSNGVHGYWITLHGTNLAF